MLYKTKTLKGFKLDSLDGEIGKAKEFYFDDRYWTIRYLVANTGNWLTGRQVLISPHALKGVIKDGLCLTVDLTKKQIEDSPSLESDKPVSQQFEQSYYMYYGWPLYWEGPYVWGIYPNIVRSGEKLNKSAPGEKAWNPDLRSTDAVSGYSIQAIDGEIGHIEDFVIDDETWAIRYLIIKTKNWWPGNKVLISTKWIERVSWDEFKVFVGLTREEIIQSPEFTDESLLSRNYENALHNHYKRPGYWADEPVIKNHSV
jgi:hypothetical protein